MRRRLFIRPGAIGDFVLSLPAIEFLRNDTGDLEVWCASQNVPLAERAADRAASISSTGLDLVGIPGVPPSAGVMRALESFDDVVSCYGANREEFRAAAAELRVPFRFLPALPPAGGGVHAADFFLTQAGGQGSVVPRLACAPVPHGRVVIQPFSGGSRKNWPIESFHRLAESLSADGYDVAWCAGPDEELPGAVRIAGLYALAEWLAGARLYIGNDSGITHLAAAAGAPVVALFGVTDPAVWGPRGERVRIVRGPDMRAISVEAVLKACRAVLFPPR